MFGLRDLMNESVAFAGEFIGTFLFLFFAFAGTQTVNHAAALKATPETENLPNVDNLMFISIIFGISLMVNVWIFFRISGGMFNPAVTMSLYLVGAFPILRAIVVVGAQLVGGITAAAVVKFLIPDGREVKFAVSLGGGTSVVRGLFMEMFFTAELIFTILMLAAEKTKTTFIAPVGIGFALFIGHICGVFFTGAGLNPARSFGPAVVAGSFPSYHWLYWLGPVMGGLLAVAFYKLLKLLRYEEVNGDQDKAAYEPESLEKFVGRNAKRASYLLDGTSKRVSALLDKTTGTAAALYERRKRHSPNSPTSPTVFTGDLVPLRRRPADIAGTSPKSASMKSPRYQSDFNQPRNPYPQTIKPLRTRAPFSPASSQRTYVGGGSPEFHDRYPLSTIHSSPSTPPSSILNAPPPPAPMSPYDHIPIGMVPRAGRYMQGNPQEDINRNNEAFRLPGGAF